MLIGMARLRLQFPSADERDRHRLLRRVTDRVRARYNASIADVSGDEPRIGTLAIAIAGSEHAAMQQALDKLTNEVSSIIAGEAMITGNDIEIQSYNDSEPLGADDYTPMAKGAFNSGEFEPMLTPKPLPRRRKGR